MKDHTDQKTKPVAVYLCDKLKYGIFCIKDRGHAGECEQRYVQINNGSDDRSMYDPK